MNTEIELSNLIKSFSQLTPEEQNKEIQKKIKLLIGILNKVNKEKELLFIPVKDEKNLTSIFSLLCCLEDEIGKLLIENFNNQDN